MSLLERLNPAGVPAPGGQYSHLSITRPMARTATFAGQVAPGAGVAEQARLVFAAIEGLLSSQGATPADLIKLTTYVVGRENLADFAGVRTDVYGRWFPEGDFPPNTLLLVAGLASESLLVEIEGSFVCPAKADS